MGAARHLGENALVGAESVEHLARQRGRGIGIGGADDDHRRDGDGGGVVGGRSRRSEEHTSELQSLMRISYAVFCLKKKKKQTTKDNYSINNTRCMLIIILQETN